MWTQQLISSLIKDIQQVRCLWDVKCPDFKDRNKKDKAICILAARYGVSPAELNKKICSLRSQFRREHKKIVAARGYETPYTWFGYQPMKFLLSNYSSNSVISDVEFGEETESDDGFTSEDINIKSERDNIKIESNNFRNEPNVIIHNDNFPAPIETFPKPPANKSDSLSIFSDFVADSLRNCNRPQQEIFIAQNQINQIIFRLQMGGFASENQNHYLQSPSQSNNT